MILDYLRLAIATAIVLAPGHLIARSLGMRSTSAMLGCAFGVMFVAWAVVFSVHGSVWLALALVLLSALLALPLRAWGAARRGRAPGARPARRRRDPTVSRSAGAVHRLVFGAGVALGLLLWRVAGVVSGDGLFHLAVVRKLVDLGGLHLRTVDQFVNGGLHPGYAFPLWHGFLALVSVVSGLDPSIVLNHEASVLAPLALCTVFEAGLAVFGSAGGGVAVVAATLGLFCFSAGHGGSYTSLALPPTAARQLLVPAFYALFFGYLRSGRRVELAVLFTLFGSLALIHSTYALFSLIPLGAYALVRPHEWRRSGAALATALVPAAAVYLWLRPLIDQTLTHNPSPASARDALQLYAGQLVISSLHDYRLAAGVVGRAGAVAVAALALAPLGGLALRRWGAFVVAGTVTIVGLMLIPVLFVHFSDLASLSQSRRAAGFVPFAFAFAGGLLLISRTLLVVPLALVAGIALQELWPGDFGNGQHGGPALVTWFALIGGAVALAGGLLLVRKEPRERPAVGALAALAFVLPVAAHGFANWTPVSVTKNPQSLIPASLHAQLARLPPRTVVIASSAISYVILADFPLYVVAAPLAHVAHTRANDPEARIKAVNEWLKTDNPAIPRRYRATWAVRNDRLYPLDR